MRITGVATSPAQVGAPSGDLADDQLQVDPRPPRMRLRSVAQGLEPLRQEDLQALVVQLAVSSFEQTRFLDARQQELVALLFSGQRPAELDVGQALRLAARLAAMSRRAGAELRRDVDLLHRLNVKAPPRVRVVAAEAVVAVGEHQNVAAAIDLGGERGR